MKIGVVCYPSFGGSGVIATELGIAMAQRGHEVHFISYETPIRLQGYIKNVYYHEVQVPSYPLFKYPPYALALASHILEIVQSHGLDLLHAHYAIPHTISAYLAQQMAENHGFKIVTTLHGTDIMLVGREDPYRSITQFALRASDGVTAVSKFLADYTHETFHADREIRVIHNFVDTNRFCADRRPFPRSDFAEDNEKIFTHISNFRPIKRVCDIIQMFARVSKRLPAQLLMVGDGPDQVDAEALARRLGVEDRVRFLGRQSNVEGILAISDLFVMASEMESFGLASLEALSCGVPVIGTRQGGFGEVVEAGKTGLLFEVGDTQQMADLAVDLLTDEKRYLQFSQSARQAAMTQFSVNDIIPLYEGYYFEVLNGDHGKRTGKPS